MLGLTDENTVPLNGQELMAVADALQDQLMTKLHWTFNRSLRESWGELQFTVVQHNVAHMHTALGKFQMALMDYHPDHRDDIMEILGLTDFAFGLVSEIAEATDWDDIMDHHASCDGCQVCAHLP